MSRQSETYPYPADLGGAMFVRSTQRVGLTPAGEVLFDEARRVLCARSRDAGALMHGRGRGFTLQRRPAGPGGRTADADLRTRYGNACQGNTRGAIRSRPSSIK